jgi:hypothetical protein
VSHASFDRNPVSTICHLRTSSLTRSPNGWYHLGPDSGVPVATDFPGSAFGVHRCLPPGVRYARGLAVELDAFAQRRSRRWPCPIPGIGQTKYLYIGREWRAPLVSRCTLACERAPATPQQLITAHASSVAGQCVRGGRWDRRAGVHQAGPELFGGLIRSFPDQDVTRFGQCRHHRPAWAASSSGPATGAGGRCAGARCAGGGPPGFVGLVAGGAP